MRSDWLRVALLLSEISPSIGLFGIVCKINKILFMITMSLILNVLFDDEMSLSKFNQVLFLTNNHILGYPDYFI